MTGPTYLIGPDGSPLTIADLPAPGDPARCSVGKFITP